MLRRILNSYRNAYRGVPRDVWLLSLVLLVSRSGTMVLPYLSIYATREQGIPPMSVGWLLAFYGVGGVVSAILGGWITARIGAIATQVLSFALSIPGFLILERAASFEQMCGALLYLGIAVEMMRPAANTATIEFCTDESQHTRALAVNRLAVNLGMSIGPTVGGFLAVLDYRWLFWGNAIGAAAAILVMLATFGTGRKIAKQATSATSDPPMDGAGKAVRARSPWRDGRYVAFCALNALVSIVFFQFLGTYPLYLNEQYHLSEDQIGLLFAVNTIVIVLFELILVNAIRDLPLVRVFAWGHLLGCAGFGLLPLAVGSPFAAGYAWCVVTMLILTAGEMLAMPLGAAYAARRSTPANRGHYMGVYASSFSIAVLVAPVVGMWLYARNPHLVWYSGLIAGSAVFIGLLKIADLEKSSNGDGG